MSSFTLVSSHLIRALKLWRLALIAVTLIPVCTLSTLAENASKDLSVQAKKRIVSEYGKLPLSFEANWGQSDSQVKFLSRGRGYTLFLTSSEAVLSLQQPPIKRGGGNAQVTDRTGGKEGKATQTAMLRMKLLGGNADPRVTGLEKLPGTSNYFIGNDPDKWRTNVAHYAKVTYEDVYPGISLVYYGNLRQLEYDFVVAPGADPGAILLGFEGLIGLQLDEQGNLVIQTAGGEILQQRPIVYQEVEGVRHELFGGYVLKAENQIAFEVGAYDPDRPLVIDPVLSYSTYLGGSEEDTGFGIAVDAAGNTYVTGFTESIDFPTTLGTVDDLCGTDGLCDPDALGVLHSDVFVTKLNATGSALVYSTYLGGSADDSGFGIAVDTDDNAYLTGSTLSADFPTTSGTVDELCGTNGLCDPDALGVLHSDAFVTKLDAAGSALVYSTYLGGSKGEIGWGMAVDATGNAYLTGTTTSDNFPTANPVLPVGSDAEDAFVTKLNAAGSALVYSTYLGGSDNSATEGFSIAVDATEHAYVTGQIRCRASDTICFHTVNALQPTPGSFFPLRDAFVTKFDPTGLVVYSTFLGGIDTDVGLGIAADTDGNAYVTGSTLSADFPTENPLQSALLGPGDAFVVKLNPTGSSPLIYSTYLGGSGVDSGQAIAADAAGNAYVTGNTSSTDFPTENPLQSTLLGSGDAFVTKLNPTGSPPLIHSTYLGGDRSDLGLGIAVDTTGSTYVTGRTNSIDFPTTEDAIQQDLGGARDAYVVKIVISDDQGPLTSDVIANPNPVPVNTALTLTANVDDTDTGGSNIAAAQYSIDGGSAVTMDAQDTDFDSVSEDVVATVPAFEIAGVQSLCVNGTDAFANTGPEECILLAVFDPNGAFVTGGVDPVLWTPDP